MNRIAPKHWTVMRRTVDIAECPDKE